MKVMNVFEIYESYESLILVDSSSVSVQQTDPMEF